MNLNFTVIAVLFAIVLAAALLERFKYSKTAGVILTAFLAFFIFTSPAFPCSVNSKTSVVRAVTSVLPITLHAQDDGIIMQPPPCTCVTIDIMGQYPWCVQNCGGCEHQSWGCGWLWTSDCNGIYPCYWT